MTGRIDKEILRFNVTVHHVLLEHIIQGSQQLVAIQFDQKRMCFLSKIFEMLDCPIHIERDVVHDKVQLCLALLVLLLDEIRISHSDDVLMMHLFVNHKLSRFIVFVMDDLLHCYNCTCPLLFAHVDRCKCALSNKNLRREFVLLLQK